MRPSAAGRAQPGRAGACLPNAAPLLSLSALKMLFIIRWAELKIFLFLNKLKSIFKLLYFVLISCINY
ncbi:MAG: hypothetical protein DBY09_00680 [Selenomonadales bacterium]|nr:MAG: hypothetical protein DBY09_00680 [Selenomonadales bacterium]